MIKIKPGEAIAELNFVSAFYPKVVSETVCTIPIPIKTMTETTTTVSVVDNDGSAEYVINSAAFINFLSRFLKTLELCWKIQKNLSAILMVYR